MAGIKRLSRDDVRALLRAHLDGLTTDQLAEKLETSRGHMYPILYAMPDAYIDRWEKAAGNQYAAVWCVVIPPNHCPHPNGRVVAVRPRGRKAVGENPPAAN